MRTPKYRKLGMFSSTNRTNDGRPQMPLMRRWTRALNYCCNVQVNTPPPECDLIAKGVIDDEQRGAVLNSDSQFVVARASADPVPPAQLKCTARSGANVVTFTRVPPGNGMRMGVDRDLDGAFDADEADAGTDAANALSKQT